MPDDKRIGEKKVVRHTGEYGGALAVQPLEYRFPVLPNLKQAGSLEPEFGFRL